MAVFEDVPDEIIRQILQYISPEETFGHVQLVSKRLNHLANEHLLWKYYCQISFRYWDDEHGFEGKLKLKASQTAWAKLWRRRKRRNAKLLRLLDEIIATKVGRVQRIGQICQYGYDARDFLLEQSHTDDSAEDALARRYWANSALASIYRSLAVREWSRYQRAPLTAQGLDRALAAFDMFFIRGDDDDIDDTCASLDRLAAEFLQEHDTFEDMSNRDKALALLKWVRERSLTGMDEPEDNYRNLRNALIGHALRDERHPSLPIISAAIYTCLAERVGLRAACCAFPSHVHAMVMAPAGKDLDGKESSSRSTDVDKMFLDPYGSSEEIQFDDLRSRLVELDWLHGREAFLVPAPVPVIVQRVGRNMAATFGVFWNTRHEHLAILREDRPATRMNVESAAYAARWANLLMTPVSNFQWDSTLDQFLNQVTQQFPEDAWMVEEYILPLYNIYSQSVQPRIRFTWENVPEMLGMIRNMDNRQPTVNRRYTQEIHQNVWYTVGQVFRHTKYHYIGIINGWCERGTASLPTPHNMSMEEAMDEMADSGTDSDTLRERLRKKTYYTCLRHNHDRHVLAQDNIEIIRDPNLIPESLMQVAGKFFKSFDHKTCTFVSNIKEYFPDD